MAGTTLLPPTTRPALSAVDQGDAAATQAYRDEQLARLRDLPPGSAEHAALRARVIEWYLPIAVHLARRYVGRGEPQADLTQVAVIGLIKAVDRFDADRGLSFPTYAVPTILGELKRHFRDTAWSVRVPRRLQELTLNLTAAADDLTQALHRSPTTAELAAELGVSQREVVLAKGCATAYRPVSVNQSTSGHDGLCLIDTIAVTDHGVEAVDNRETLRVLLAGLPVREQLVVRMRFDAELTQAQIAARIGVSQMHVSRLLARSLAQLRDGMLTDIPAATSAPIRGARRSPSPRQRVSPIARTSIAA